MSRHRFVAALVVGLALGQVLGQVLGFAGTARAQEPSVPVLAGRVNDYADMLRPADDAALEAKLKQLEDDTGTQVVVLTVPTIGDTPIEDYGIRVAETWKIGRKDTDTGAILIIARDDRKMRLEVGYGLEGTLTDLRSKRIISDIIAPHFRDGDNAGGVNAGVDAIAAAIRGDPSVIDQAPAPGSEDSGDDWWVLLVFAVLGLFIPGIFGWLVYAFVAVLLFGNAGSWGAGPALVAVVLWLLGAGVARVVMAKMMPKTPRGPSSGAHRSHGPMWSGSSGGSGWRGGGFGGGGWGGGGGGGFSGGGGSFGGGGASGGW